MRMDASIHNRLEQQLRLAPQIIQSIEILQLTALDLQDLIRQELSENEMLEEVTEPGAQDPLVEQNGVQESAPSDEDFERLENLNDWSDYFTRRRREDGEPDKKLEAMQNTAARPCNLRERLEADLRLVEADPDLKTIAGRLVQCLDDNGYLNEPLEGLKKLFEDEVAEDVLERALVIVQSLEPRGVGARNLQECLMLQLEANDEKYDLKRRLLLDHFGDLSKNRLPKIARDTNQSLDDLKAVLLEMSSLDPAPGSRLNPERPHYIHPDAIVEWTDGDYMVRLTDGNLPALRLSPKYMRLHEMSEEKSQLKDYIQKKIDSARWLIESIQNRQNTLLRVCLEIIRHQREFLDHGIASLRPLKMQDVADTLGVHVSTVSRAISNKYVQTHRGIFSLKFFFSGATGAQSSELESRTSVKTRVEDMIKAEDRRSPLSDDEIARCLHALGLPIARRTVTKYRKAMGIPSSRQRKEY